MINADEIDPPRPVAKAADLGTLSIGELKDYILSLRAEIERAEQAIAAKQATRSGAEALFMS